MPPRPNRAVVRPPPTTYAPFYRAKGIEVIPSLAAQQHGAYANALRKAGLHVETLPADDAYYDCVFVEDTAVLWQQAVLITSMGGPDREGEQEAVRDFLIGTHRVVELPSGARLEGGDVLHTEDVTYVGLSSRTNALGAEALRNFMSTFGRPVVAIEVTNALHLKTAVTYLGNGTLIAADGCVDFDRFEGLAVIHTAPGEASAANCLRLGNCLLIPSGYPAAEKALTEFAASHQLGTEVLDISEFEKGGGSLSCLSLLWRDEAR